jgi:phenylalanyl-tRNA synthetase beta chain
VEQIESILTPLEFKVRRVDNELEVDVPSFRATKDITIEADVIEEVARFIGYNSIEPKLPEVTVRYAEPEVITQLEKQTLSLLCGGMGYAEIHRHIWFDADWLKIIGYDPGPTVNLKNPSAMGMERLRTTLIPGILSAVDLNRRHYDKFELLEIGSVFSLGKFDDPSEAEDRHLALALVAPGRKASHEDALLRRMKTDLETFAYQIMGSHIDFAPVESSVPWEHEAKTASASIEECNIGRLSVLPLACKRRIDEHLAAWSIALAEINLSVIARRQAQYKKLAPVPVYPCIEVDFSVVADASRRYSDIEQALSRYDHPLLTRLAFMDSYEGGSVPAGQRSFTFRSTIADPNRTLTEEDIQSFRTSFIEFLTQNKLQLRT